jgi:hypothetical protein
VVLLQAEVQRLRREVGSLSKRSEAGDDERSSLKRALADAQVRRTSSSEDVCSWPKVCALHMKHLLRVFMIDMLICLPRLL